MGNPQWYVIDGKTQCAAINTCQKIVAINISQNGMFTKEFVLSAGKYGQLQCCMSTPELSGSNSKGQGILYTT